MGQFCLDQILSLYLNVNFPGLNIHLKTKHDRAYRMKQREQKLAKEKAKQQQQQQGRTTTRIRQYKCHICQEAFLSRSGCENHAQVQHGLAPLFTEDGDEEALICETNNNNNDNVSDCLRLLNYMTQARNR